MRYPSTGQNLFGPTVLGTVIYYTLIQSQPQRTSQFNVVAHIEAFVMEHRWG